MLIEMLMQVAATACPTALPPPSEKKAPLKPLLSYDDYPLEAVRHGWEGDVVVDLTISPIGTVTGCQIVQSSGHSVLDNATCKIMLTRARFSPARDADCNPIENKFRTPPIRWRIR
jgi:protein TonB